MRILVEQPLDFRPLPTRKSQLQPYQLLLRGNQWRHTLDAIRTCRRRRSSLDRRRQPFQRRNLSICGLRRPFDGHDRHCGSFGFASRWKSTGGRFTHRLLSQSEGKQLLYYYFLFYLKKNNFGVPHLANFIFLFNVIELVSGARIQTQDLSVFSLNHYTMDPCLFYYSFYSFYTFCFFWNLFRFSFIGNARKTKSRKFKMWMYYICGIRLVFKRTRVRFLRKDHFVNIKVLNKIKNFYLQNPV